MAVQIQFRRDTAANWTSANPVLAVGEQGLETDTLKRKMGNGSTVWNSLGYEVNGNMIGSNNLSEITTPATARTNLGLGTLATQSGTFSGTSSGTNTGDQTSVSGNAGTATKLAATKNINGVAFDGSADITVPAAGSTLTDAVPNSKLATMATKTYKGRTTAGTGAPEDVAVATLKTDLVLVKGDVGLGSVDNTSDAGKPVSTATQTQLDLKAPLASPTFTGTVVVPDASFALAKLANMATASLYYRKTAGTGVPEVNTLATLKTDLVLVKADVGLGSCDNTSDAGKPVSSATQTALNLKADLASPTFSGTPSLPTGTTATTQSAADSTTKLATTAFATTADNLKANLASPTLTGTPAAPTAAVDTNTTQIATTAYVVGQAYAKLASPTLVTPVIGAATGTSVVLTGIITSSSPTAGIGYATGAGGAVTQLTSKATATPSINKMCGTVTMNAAALAADTGVAHVLTNTSIAANDMVVVNHTSGGTLGAYTFAVAPAAGSATITVRNVTPGSLSEAVVYRFSVIKGVVA